MSTQSLKEHVTKKPLSRSVFKTRTSKLQRIQVSPLPHQGCKNVVTAEKWPSTGKEVPLFLESIEDQGRVGTPSGHDNITFEVDETRTPWSKAENGKHDH